MYATRQYRESAPKPETPFRRGELTRVASVAGLNPSGLRPAAGDPGRARRGGTAWRAAAGEIAARARGWGGRRWLRGPDRLGGVPAGQIGGAGARQKRGAAFLGPPGQRR